MKPEQLENRFCDGTLGRVGPNNSPSLAFDCKMGLPPV
jgi:hypothetical protein